MTALAIGGLALAAGLLLLHAFANASVASVKRGLAWGAAALGVAVVGTALATGRGLGGIVWSLVLFGPALWRWWAGRRLAARFSRESGDAGDGSPPPGGGGAGARGEAVETAWLSMRLDPVAGTLSGTVRAGAFAGRDLADLTPTEALALRAALERDDPEGVPLLDAWLDRAYPRWRDAADGARGGAGPRDRSASGGGGPMTRAEALAVLGLEEGRADPAAVRAAYTRLMRAAHPDAGGSDWIAARLNEARDVLLRAAPGARSDRRR